MEKIVKRILGIDCSSTTIGWCVLEVDDANHIKFINAGFLKPIKNGTIIERLVDTRNKIQNIINETAPDFIAIEDIIQFMAGGSSAKTIIILTSFNRMIGLAAYDYLKISPKLLNVMSIRHCLKRKAHLDYLPKKEELPGILENLLGIQFPWIYGKKGNIKTENYDVSDAISCAYCYIVNEILYDNSETRKNTNNKKRKINKSLSEQSNHSM